MSNVLATILFCIFSLGVGRVAAQPCDTPDLAPPTAVCQASPYYLNLWNGNPTTIFSAALNAGSYDNCPGALWLNVEKFPVSSSPPTTNTVQYTLSDLGENEVALWVTDGAGNSDYCTLTVKVDTCSSSTLPVCQTGITIEVETGQTVDFYPADLLEGGPYCLHQMVIGNVLYGAPQPFMTFHSQDAGTYSLQVTHLPTGNVCWDNVEVISECSDDTTAPVASCKSSLSVQLSEDGPSLTYVQATELNDGSSDNCAYSGELTFAIEAGPTPSQTMPTNAQLDFISIGTYQDVVMWVADEAGNTSHCAITIEVIASSCSPDQIPPILYSPLDTTIHSDDLAAMNIDPQNTQQLDQYFGDASAWDFCGMDTVTQTAQVVTNACGYPKLITRSFWAFDNAGNSTVATQTINIIHDFSINIPKDYLPGDAGDPEELTFLQGNGTQLSVSSQDELVELSCDTTTDFIRRTWTIYNWCEIEPDQVSPPELPRLDQDNDGTVGDAYVAWALPDSVYLLDNGFPVMGLVLGNPSLQYVQIIRYTYDDTLAHAIAGSVFIDDIANCTMDTGETGLVDWTVKAVGLSTGTVYTATTQANGVYQINGICPSDTELDVSLDVPFNYGQSCPTTWTVQTIPNMPAVQHIPVHLNDDCPLMSVDLSTPFLRRCFPNTYGVTYNNFSNQTVEGAYVEVQLDSFMGFTFSSLPGNSLGDNRYAFSLGDLTPGQHGAFTIHFDLGCDAELGQTHCTEAHIYPDTLCPANVNWSGANIEVEGKCADDEIRLTIRNTGTGDMAAPLDFIVVEDVIMYMEGSFNLGAGQSYPVPPIPANGETWRLEAQQVPLHPFPGTVAVAVEGCNGLNTTGLVNLFSIENPNPFIAVDCQENIGAFDPNDKQAVPTGYGEEHFIERNTDIEYLIRFQNTGTDTAFNVVVLDTLSQHLDPTTIRPGVSSHPFSFEVLDGHILRFTFADILLPDSNINEAASHGFVKFMAKQQLGLTPGTVIENTAAIYFDFNEPVITNTVFHTIGENFIEILNDAHETASGHGQPKVFPNPAFGAVTFALPVELGENASFQLHDNLGKLVRMESVSGTQFRFERKALAPGMYFYTIENEGIKMFTGKVILK